MDTKHTPGAPPPEGGYEKSDANPSSLLRFGFVLLVTLVLAWGASKWIFDYFDRVQSLGPPPTPFEQGRPVPPLPQLQVHPVQDLEQFRAGQEKALDSYGWVDQSRGIVHIPIGRAMDLLLERGLPTRAGIDTAKAANSPAGAKHGSGN